MMGMDLTQFISAPVLDAFESGMGVVRGCVCHNTSLKTLREMCSDNTDNIDSACDETGCSSSCGLCKPYIFAAIKCKADELAVMWTEDFVNLGIHPGRIAQVEWRLEEEKRQASQEKPAD